MKTGRSVASGGRSVKVESEYGKQSSYKDLCVLSCPNNSSCDRHY